LPLEIDQVKYTGKYTGKIDVIPLGVENVPLGGSPARGFHDFEGAPPDKPKLGLQVWDLDPGHAYAGPLAEAFPGVLDDPGAWAKTAVERGVVLFPLHLKSSDPNDRDPGPEEAMAATAKVLAAVDVPVIVFRVDNPEKGQAAPAAESKPEPVPPAKGNEAAPAPRAEANEAAPPTAEAKPEPAPPAVEKKPEAAPAADVKIAAPVAASQVAEKHKPARVAAAAPKIGGSVTMTEQKPKASEIEKPEEVICNQIIDELDRVHMRIPRY
jgi:hypothetical protein